MTITTQDALIETDQGRGISRLAVPLPKEKPEAKPSSKGR